MRNPIVTGLLLAAATLSAPAFANPYTAMYVFGDSLYDNGQFAGTRFTNRVGPNYTNSEFGPVSPSLVAQGLGLDEAAASRAGGTNYAVGANRSIDTLLSIIAPTTYQASAGIGNPGIDATFNSLFYDLERSGRSFDKNAVYIMDGGGNDIGNVLVTDDKSAAVVATNMVDAANALKGRGAKYVVITNIPDFGLAPRGIPFSEFATTMAGKVNEQVQQQVGADNILIVDAFTMLQEIVADPTAYGFNLTSSEISRACFDTSESVCSQGNGNAKIGGGSPDPDQFMFNDPLHPTTMGQMISAGYMLSILTAPGEVSLLPQMGIDDMQAQWRSARPVMQSNRWQATTPVGGYTVWGGANWSEDKHETSYNNTGTNKAGQYNVGVSFRPAESWYIGGQIGRANNELDFGASASKYEMESLNFTLLAGFNYGKWFAEGMISYSDLDYDNLKRRFNLGPALQRTETADTSGEVTALKLTGGLNLIDAGETYRFGPTWSYEYIDSDVDAYKEKGNDATALRVNDMNTSAGIGSAGLFGDMQLGFCACQAYSELTYRAHLDNDSTNPRIGLVTVSGNSAKLPGYEQDDDSVRWDVGMAAKLSPALDLNIGGGLTDTDNGDAFWYGAELTYTF